MGWSWPEELSQKNCQYSTVEKMGVRTRVGVFIKKIKGNEALGRGTESIAERNGRLYKGEGGRALGCGEDYETKSEAIFGQVAKSIKEDSGVGLPQEEKGKTFVSRHYCLCGDTRRIS